jgi:hypothetical protein
VVPLRRRTRERLRLDRWCDRLHLRARAGGRGQDDQGEGDGVERRLAAGHRRLGPPANTGLPTITGTSTVGSTLTAGNGTWSGYPAPSFAYQWRTCDSAGANCADIPLATASTYIVVAGDAAHTIRVAVIGTNGSGSASATSASVGIPGAPLNLVAPTISGTAQTGSTLTAAPGSWLGVPTPTFAYQWKRCDPTGAACSAIPLANAATYQPSAPDLGLTLRVEVTGTNGAGSDGPVQSVQTAVVTNPPVEGGGPSGGGVGTSDLVATITAPATVKVGDSFSYQVSAQDLGTGGSDGIVATITLPAGVTLGAVAFDRGAGCTGTTVLTCQLDFLNGGLVAHLRIDVQAQVAGSLVATVALAAHQPDVNPANNTATATTLVTPTQSVVVVPAPKLVRVGTAAV